MWKRLGDVAEVLTGYPFRGKVMPDDDGELVVMQIKDLNTDGGLDLDGALRIREDTNYQRHLLRANDILLQSRGSTNRASIFEGTVRAIAALGLFVIRPDARVVRPGYLLWCMNHPRTQDRLRDLTRGSTVPFISKADTADFTVPTPSLRVQEQVIAIDRLRQQERALAADLDRLRTRYIETLVWQAAASGPTKRV
jgi:restriction endonuclease S subunit